MLDGVNANRSSRLVSLDGLRALSIILVLIGHLSHTQQFKKNISYAEYFDWSDFGVHFFFVISGFLISVLLLGEEKKTSSINLKNFYVRRLLRIFPAYYFFLLCVFLMTFKFPLDITTFAGALTFTTGLPVFGGSPGWTLGHTWSLAVEEQFYILYPFFLFSAVKRNFRIAILLSAVVFFPLLRSYLYHTCYPEFSYSILYRGDCIVWGCLLAFYKDQLLLFLARQKKWLMPSILFTGGMVIMLKICSIQQRIGFITIPFINTFESLLACLIIINFTIYPRDLKNLSFRVLNSKGMILIGTLSYSIYLWQQLVIQPHSYEFPWALFPLNIVIIFFVAFFSYQVIEQPFLKFRKYFQ